MGGWPKYGSNRDPNKKRVATVRKMMDKARKPAPSMKVSDMPDDPPATELEA